MATATLPRSFVGTRRRAIDLMRRAVTACRP